MSPLEISESIGPLNVPATKGDKRFSDFVNASLDISASFFEQGFVGGETISAATEALFFQITEEMTVRDVYLSLDNDLRKLAFTPEQLGEFVALHRKMLHNIGISTFFLLAQGEKVCAGIFTPYVSGYFFIRMYTLNSVYKVRAQDRFLFLVRK